MKNLRYLFMTIPLLRSGGYGGKGDCMYEKCRINIAAVYNTEKSNFFFFDQEQGDIE